MGCRWRPCDEQPLLPILPILPIPPIPPTLHPTVPASSRSYMAIADGKGAGGTGVGGEGGPALVRMQHPTWPSASHLHAAMCMCMPRAAPDLALRLALVSVWMAQRAAVIGRLVVAATPTAIVVVVAVAAPSLQTAPGALRLRLGAALEVCVHTVCIHNVALGQTARVVRHIRFVIHPAPLRQNRKRPQREAGAQGLHRRRRTVTDTEARRRHARGGGHGGVEIGVEIGEIGEIGRGDPHGESSEIWPAEIRRSDRERSAWEREDGRVGAPIVEDALEELDGDDRVDREEEERDAHHVAERGHRLQNRVTAVR